MGLLDIEEKRGDYSYKLLRNEEHEAERVLYWVELCFNQGDKWCVKAYWESYFASFKTLSYKVFNKIAKSGVLSDLENRSIYKALQEYNPPKTGLKECFEIYKQTGGIAEYNTFVERAIIVSCETCLLSSKDLFKPQFICNYIISKLNKEYQTDFPFLSCATIPQKVISQYNFEAVLCRGCRDWFACDIKELREIIIEVYISVLNLNVKDIWRRYCDEVGELSYRQFLRYFHLIQGDIENLH